MDVGEIVVTIIGVLSIGGTLWKAANAYAKNELLVEAAEKTIAEKDIENSRLWALLDYLTRPEVKQ